MKRYVSKGAKLVNNPALPNRQAMMQLNKSPHRLIDYMKLSPMTMQPTNLPATPTVIQGLGKGTP